MDSDKVAKRLEDEDQLDLFRTYTDLRKAQWH